MPASAIRPTPEQRAARADELAKAGRHGEAAAILRGLIRDYPRIAALHFNLGNALRGQGDTAGALRCFRQAGALEPALADAHFNLGNCHRDLAQRKEAIAAYQAALAANPGHAGALCNAGGLLLDAGDAGAAAAYLRRALTVDPAFPPAPNLLGLASGARADAAGAVRWLVRAIGLDPAHSAAWSNLGELARAEGRPDEAERCQRAALQLVPDNPGLLTNLGIVLADRQQPGAALTLYDRALAIAPALNQALWNKGLVLLSRGDLERGFALYEHRFGAGATALRPLAAPPWRGEPLNGRRLLIWREQGVGDEILWSSCLPEVLGLGPCVLACEPRLAGLFARSFPQVDIQPDTGGDLPAADLQVPIGSLPLYTRRQLEDFPGRPVLQADPARVARWRERLDALGPGPKIGLSWRSRRGRAGNAAQLYTRLDAWRDVPQAAGVTLVNLQYDDDPDERGGAAPALVHWPDLDLMDDFDSVAALIAALDGVVSVANTVGALAGALGRPTALLVHQSDWTLLGTRRFPWARNVECLIREAGEEGWSRQIAAAGEWLRTTAGRVGD